MNIIQRSLQRLIGTHEDRELLANGRFKDKIDVEDPTGSFHGIRHVTPRYQRFARGRTVEFIKPEYDLPTIANALAMDGYLQRAVNIYVEQILKNGYEITSKNDRAQKHVARRMKEIQHLTNIPFYETMNYVSRQLVTYANAYLIKVRSEPKSRYGRKFRLYGKDMAPVVGLFVADATTMEAGVDPRGQVVYYKQNIGGSEMFFDARDVIHLTYNKIPGTYVGMSSLMPILDDLRALRKLEEEVEILGFQYAIPLYLYKVGTKDQPPAPNEISEATNMINNMPAYGMLVVPGHHSIEVPTNNNSPLDLISFINHFKLRIFSGLGVSPVAMGEVQTSNRNTSEVLDMSMQTITKRYQQIIKHELEMGLIREFMLDGGFDTINAEVEFNFPEIDLENQIKKETNIIAKWQNNLVSRQEARLELDYERAINDPDTFLRLIEIPKIEAEKSISIEVAKIGARAAKAKSSASSTSTTKAKRSISNKVAPANQYGKSSGRPKIVKNSYEDEVSHRLIQIYDGTSVSNLNANQLSSRLTKELESKLKNEVSKKLKQLSDTFHLDLSNLELSSIDEYIAGVKVIVSDKLKRVPASVTSDSKAYLVSGDLAGFLRLQETKMTNLARVLVYKYLGFKTILINAEACSRHVDTFMPFEDLSYARIPPFRYNCNCEVSEEGFYDFD